MWLFPRRSKSPATAVTDGTERLLQGYDDLRQAATGTADVANTVADRLRQRYEDTVQQLETTMRVLNDALIMSTGSGLITSHNPAAELLFGLRADSVAKTNILDLFRYCGERPASVELLQAALNNDEDGGQPDAKLFGCDLAGQSFAIDASLTVLTRSNGAIALLLLIRDLRDLADAENRANNHERRYRALFEFNFDGVLITQKRKIVAVNGAAGRLFGKTPDGLINTELANLVTHHAPGALCQGVPTPADIVAGDGQRRQLLLTSIDIQWNDEPACLIAIKDVSFKLDLSKHPRFDNGVDMIVVFSSGFDVIYANDSFCRYYGVAQDSIVGTDLREVLPATERASFLLNVGGLTLDSPTSRMQTHTPLPDGSRLLDWIDHAAFDEQGQIIEYQRTGRDITEAMTRILAPPEADPS